MATLHMSKEGLEIVSSLSKLSTSFKIHSDHIFVAPGRYGIALYKYPETQDDDTFVIKSDETIGIKNIPEFLKLIGDKKITYQNNGNFINLKKGNLKVKYGIDTDSLIDKNDDNINMIINSEEVISFDLSLEQIEEITNIQSLLKLPSMKINKTEDGEFAITPFNQDFPDENQSSLVLDNVNVGTGIEAGDALLLPSKDKKSMLELLIPANYKVKVVKGDVNYIIFKAKLDKDTQGSLLYIFVVDQIID